MNTVSDFTTPLEGEPYYTSTGIIQAIDRYNSVFTVGEVSYQRFDDQNFQYVFIPYWDYIESVPDYIFNGIPGIDLDIRKEKYYRVNMTPSFIENRTPGPSRADLDELLKEVGLDYYDRFEWLLRTDKRCGDDNLIVIRKRNENRLINGVSVSELNDLQRCDTVIVDDICDIKEADKDIPYDMFRLLYSGAEILIESEHRYVEHNERMTMLYMLKRLLCYSENFSLMRRRQGIDKAKEQGKYKGRKRLAVDPILLTTVAAEFKSGRISEIEAMNKLDISSRSTFYRRLKEISDRLPR